MSAFSDVLAVDISIQHLPLRATCQDSLVLAISSLLPTHSLQELLHRSTFLDVDMPVSSWVVQRIKAGQAREEGKTDI
jgi:hypothetical protein